MVLAKFTKHITRGILQGHSVEETMPFASLRMAEDWLEAIQRKSERGKVAYRVDNFEIIREK